MKPDLTDQSLDQLLASLPEPEQPNGLNARIMANLPPQRPTRSPRWREQIAALLGTDRLILPAGGALASMAIGLVAGYLLAPLALQTGATGANGQTDFEETEYFLAAALDSDLWIDLDGEAGP